MPRHSNPGQREVPLQQRIELRIDWHFAARLKCVFPSQGTGTWFAPRRHRQPFSACDRSYSGFRPFPGPCSTRTSSPFCLQVCYPASWGLTMKCVWFVCVDNEPGPIDGGNRPCKRPVQPPALHWPLSLAIPIDSATPLFPHQELDWRAPCLRIPFIES